MDHTSKINCNSTTIREEGGKGIHGLRKASNRMEFKDLEEKARLFYKLAVVKDRKFRFRTYRSTFVGKEMVDSMVVSGLAESREQAVQLGRTIAERFDLFENCEKRFINKTTYFEDEPNRLYRFSSGALVLIRNINEREMNGDENSILTGLSGSVSTTSNKGRPSRGPGLQRQNGTRMIKPYKSVFENDVSDDKVWSKKKKLDITLCVPRSPIQAAIEEDNESRSSSVPSWMSTIHTVNTEVERLRYPRKLTKESTEPEIAAIRRNYSKEKKVELDKTKAMHQRSIAQYQTPMQTEIASAQSVAETSDRDEIGTSANGREKQAEYVIPILEKKGSTNRGDKFNSFSNKFDAFASNLFPEKCRTVETRDKEYCLETVKTRGEDRHTSLIDEFDKEVMGDHALMKESSPAIHTGGKSKGPSEAQNLRTCSPPVKDHILHRNLQLTEQIDPEPGIHPVQQDGSEEHELHPFVTSPQDLPAGLRRRMSDNTETFDNFEFILNEKEGNLLTRCNDDDQSMWTEYIIGDDEGRKKYRQNETRQSRPSYVSRVETPAIDNTELIVVKNGTVYKDTKSDEEVMSSKLNWQQSDSPASAKQDVDDQSYMDYTIFDDTVAISYVEDDEEYIVPGSPPPPPLQEDEKSLFHIFSNRTPIEGNDDDDDDMTQITMDYALVRQSERNNNNAWINRSASADTGTEKSRLTSKNRIQRILWNDLSSDAFPVVRLAMEELRRIVASEPENRKQIVRMGGVMAIMGTMERCFKQEVIQYYCCVVIELLASMEPEAMKAFNEMKGIQLIVRSMQDQDDSDRIQEAGRAALATLCRIQQPGMIC